MDFRDISEFIKDSAKYILVIVLVLVIVIYVASLQQVVGPSMSKTLNNKDIILIDKLSYRFSEPKRFDVKSLKHFMLFMGPLSSCFDLIVFAAMWFIFSVRDVATFQTIWFSYSIVSNLVGMHIIRTAKIPFVQSNAHKMVYFSSILLSIVGIVVPYTILGNVIGLVPLELKYLSIIIIVPILYCFVALIAKKIYIKKYGEWI